MARSTNVDTAGAGESGKSTFAKQMRILHLSGFSQDDRRVYRSVIASNILDSVLALVHGAQELGIEIGVRCCPPFPSPLTRPQCKDAAAELLQHEDYTEQDFEGLVGAVERLWADAGIKRTRGRAGSVARVLGCSPPCPPLVVALEQSYRFQLMDNCQVFVPRAREIAGPEYVPDNRDILHSRMKTTGIIETDFTVGNLKFRMVDVGGQRSERKKWMHCFQDVTAIIFCASLAEYNLKLDEDRTTNRMQESLRLFRQIVNTDWFKATDIILFLNKRDLFEEKVARVPITTAFPNYSGPQEFQACADYIQKQFLQQCEDPKKVVYPHITCATDSSVRWREGGCKSPC